MTLFDSSELIEHDRENVARFPKLSCASFAVALGADYDVEVVRRTIELIEYTYVYISLKRVSKQL